MLYLYEKLGKFFKIQTSTEWPIDRQKEWMDAVANYIADLVQRAKLKTKGDVDKMIPSYVIQGYSTGRVWNPGVGPFPVWFSENYPVEHQKIFGKEAEK
mgnify:FL=1